MARFPLKLILALLAPGITFAQTVDQLPAASSVTATDRLEARQSGTSRRTTAAQVKDYVLTSPTVTGTLTGADGSTWGASGINLVSGLSGAQTGSYGTGAYYSAYGFLLNAISPSSEYSGAQGGNVSANALTVGVAVPSSAVNHQTNALSAYVVSNRAQSATAGGNGGDVAFYPQARANATGSAVWSLNPLAMDTAGFSNQKLFNEMDFVVSGTNTLVSGLNMFLSGSGTISGAIANSCLTASSSLQWSDCYYTVDGAVVAGASFGTTGTGNNVGSVPIQFRSRSAGGASYTASILSDATGSLVIRSGLAGGYVAMQDYSGTNLFACNTGQCQGFQATASSSPATGALVLGGGLGVAGNINSGGTVKAVNYTAGSSAGVSCAAGTVNLTTLVVTNGIVTHC